MKRKLVPTLFLALLLAACASEEKRIANVPVETTLDDKPGEQVSALERDLEKARSEGVDALSPAWFKSAQLSLGRAREALNNGRGIDEIAKYTTEAKLQLERAKSFAGAARNEMGSVMAAREKAWEAYNAARKAGATNSDQLGEELSSVENRFRSATRGVEEGVAKSDEDRRDLEVAFQRVAVKATKRGKFDLAHRLLSQAKEEGASKYAPKALAYAENSVEAAEKYVESAPAKVDDIDSKVDEAILSAQRVVMLSREAKKLDAFTAEERALWVEQNLEKVAQAAELELDDRMAFDERFGVVSKSLASTLAALGPAKLAQSKRESQLTQSEAKAKAITLAKAKVATLSKMFQLEEAEVLESDGRIIIRLRGMKFPVGKSNLGSENYPLLGKVVRALETFPNATVAVEGHTDSTGSEELNLRLSRERAEGVKAYLISANAVKEGKISASGYGFTRPVAENKTAQGRAQNRRIDVVIVPSSTVAE